MKRSSARIFLFLFVTIILSFSTASAATAITNLPKNAAPVGQKEGIQVHVISTVKFNGVTLALLRGEEKKIRSGIAVDLRDFPSMAEARQVLFLVYTMILEEEEQYKAGTVEFLHSEQSTLLMVACDKEPEELAQAVDCKLLFKGTACTTLQAQAKE